MAQTPPFNTFCISRHPNLADSIELTRQIGRGPSASFLPAPDTKGLSPHVKLSMVATIPPQSLRQEMQTQIIIEVVKLDKQRLNPVAPKEQ